MTEPIFTEDVVDEAAREVARDQADAARTAMITDNEARNYAEALGSMVPPAQDPTGE